MGEAGPSALEVAARLFAAIEAGRVDDVADLYAPDMVIWRNHDGIEQTRADNLVTLRWMTTTLTDIRYTEIRRVAIDGGFVQQHVLLATNRRGEVVEAPVCMIGHVRDGLITRLEEYLDSAHVAKMVAK